jgi:arylsulfatase A-like enzyme
LAGLVGGAALAVAEVRIHADLQHGMTFLALQRLEGLAGVGVAVGISASAGVAAALALLAGSRRHKLPAAWGLAALALVALAALVRSPHSPLAPGTSAALAAFVVVVVALLLLLCRTLDTPVGESTWPPVRVRMLVSGVGVAGLSITLAASLILPRLAASRASGHPAVVLISLDTLRADRLGVLGYPRALTPDLDRLAREGAVFAQATAAAPWTKPSHASIFLSRLPFDHGARWNRTRIPSDRVMLAERFRNAGYRTAAFTGGASVHGEAGFDQGFEIYENHNEIEEGGAENHLSHATRWACGVGGTPFFLFVHTYEAHSPFVHADFADPSTAGRLPSEFSIHELDEIRGGRLVLTAQEQRYVSDLYDGDVAHTDALVGRLLAGLERCGVLAGAVVVVLSDHGEDLWDHVATRSPDHGHSLYEELLHVPLIYWAPGSIPPGQLIRTPVSLLSVAPTLLSLAGLPADPSHRGQDLAPSLRRGSEPPARPVFSESVEYGPDRFAVRDGSHKVIVAPVLDRHHGGVELEVEPVEIFDVSKDPLERRNLAADPTDRSLELLRMLRERALRILSHDRSLSEVGAAPPAEQVEQLRALGYVE